MFKINRINLTLVISVISIILLLLVIPLKWKYSFAHHSTSISVANTFIDFIAEGKYDEAYKLTTEQFKRDIESSESDLTSEDQFKERIEGEDIHTFLAKQKSEIIWKEQIFPVSDWGIHLHADVETNRINGSTSKLTINLHRLKEQWRVNFVNLIHEESIDKNLLVLISMKRFLSSISSESFSMMD